MTRADLKHCGKIPDAREELNRSVREGRIESRHSINSLEGMGSSSHDLGAELRMHSFTVNCDTFSSLYVVSLVILTSGFSLSWCTESNKLLLKGSPLSHALLTLEYLKVVL